MPTKRGILSKLASVGDPMGLVYPVTVQGKFLYREASELKQAWDAVLPKDLQWKKWKSGLPAKSTVRRSLVTFPEHIDSIELHAFGDASGRGVAAAVYAVVRGVRCGTSRIWNDAGSGDSESTSSETRIDNIETRVGRWSHGREFCPKRASCTC